MTLYCFCRRNLPAAAQANSFLNSLFYLISLTSLSHFRLAAEKFENFLCKHLHKTKNHGILLKISITFKNHISL